MSKIVKSALKVFGIRSAKEVTGVDLEEFLKELPRLLCYDVSFKKEDKEGSAAHFEIVGNEAEDFLGKNSNMLETLSHISMRLLRKNAGVSNKPLGEDSEVKNFRVTFDSSGFRERKIQELKEMVVKAQKKVIVAGGKPSYLPALSPSERKVIHTYLAELGECTSESIGKGTFKRIRIKLLPNSKHRSARPEGRPSRGDRNDRSGGDRGGRSNRGGEGRSGFSGGGRGPRRDRPSFPSDNQPNGISFVSDPFGVSRSGPSKRGGEVNGNIAVPDEVYPEIDDNIGNRMKPGEDRFDSED